MVVGLRGPYEDRQNRVEAWLLCSHEGQPCFCATIGRIAKLCREYINNMGRGGDCFFDVPDVFFHLEGTQVSLTAFDFLTLGSFYSGEVKGLPCW